MRSLPSCYGVEQHVDRGEPATQSAHASWDTSWASSWACVPGKRVADHTEPGGSGSRAAPLHGLAALNSWTA